MSGTDERPVTRLLREIGRGDARATDELLPLVYAELRQLARARMARETPGHTLQPTALVHEAYLRLVGDGDVDWENRGHFFAAAAEAMRRILIERARRVGRQRHGGDQRRVTLDDRTPAPLGGDFAELLALDQALDRLEAADAQMAAVVKLHYFAGLSVAETAQALAVSERTVSRHWTAARAFLKREMTRGAAGAPEDGG